jgi:hypothetical protein
MSTKWDKRKQTDSQNSKNPTIMLLLWVTLTHCRKDREGHQNVLGKVGGLTDTDAEDVLDMCIWNGQIQKKGSHKTNKILKPLPSHN